MNERLFPRLALAAGVAGLIGAAPAGAKVTVSAINCVASIPALSIQVSVQNPSESHATGPVWAATGSAATIVTHGNVQNLPSSAGGQTIQYYTNLVQTDEILGIDAAPSGSGPEDTTMATVTNMPLNGYFFDNDIDDATPPVPMDGVGADPPKPTLTITGPGIITPAGVYFITINIAQGGFHLPVSGADGGAIYAPDLSLALTNVGNDDGTVAHIGDGTSLTAHLSLGVDAITTCVPSATPDFETHVHTVGSAPSTSEPVAACQPGNATSGSFVITKGLLSPANQAAQAAGSAKGAVTYDGCVIPDQQSDQWVLSKHGAAAAIAASTAHAIISLKGKNFGDCTQVTVRDSKGEHENGYTNSYEDVGTLGIKWTDASNIPVKVPTTSAAVTIKVVIDENPSSGSTNAPLPTVEADGVVTKGLGVGGALHFVGELVPGNSNVHDVEVCNGAVSGSPIAPAGSYLGQIGLPAGLPIQTGPDAVLEIDRP
jgi:hypothetical protein